MIQNKKIIFNLNKMTEEPKVYSQKKTKFSGLSSPDDLIEMWRELRYDDDDEDINVIWEYEKPEQLENGFNIVNIKYNPKEPTEIGHYVLITVDDEKKEIEYFNPVASHTKDDKDKLNELLEFTDKNDYVANVDLSGKQSEGSDNCGFHCLTHAYNLYKKKNKKQGGASGIQDEKIDALIKAVRGIYYGLKYGFDKPTPKKKASGLDNEGAGLADYGKNKYTYSQLRKEVEC
jgi:hypothetical protein